MSTATTTTVPVIDPDAKEKFSITINATTRYKHRIAAAVRGLNLNEAFEEAIRQWAERNQSNNIFGTTENETSRAVLPEQIQKAS